MHALENVDAESESATQSGRTSGVFTRPPFSPESEWRELDDELREGLVERAVHRARHRREPSALDPVALGLASARGVLGLVASRTTDPNGGPFIRAAPHLVRALTGAYRFCIDVASELLAIESSNLTADGERKETSLFLPFARDRFDLLVGLRFDCLPELEGGDAECEAAFEELYILVVDLNAVRSALSRVIKLLHAAARPNSKLRRV